MFDKSLSSSCCDNPDLRVGYQVIQQNLALKLHMINSGSNADGSIALSLLHTAIKGNKTTKNIQF